MLLKNKIKIFVMASISSAVCMLAGLGCIIGCSISHSNVTSEIKNSTEYLDYYNNKVEEYSQQLKEGKITKNQFTQKIEDIGIKGFKEQLSDEEIKNIDKKYETAYNLIYSGCVLDGVGVMASVGISSAMVSDIYKDNKKEDEKEI